MNKLLIVLVGVGLGLCLRKIKYIAPVSPLIITSKFGKRIKPYDHSQAEIHNGIDIKAVTGTPVKAATNGIATVWSDKINGNGIKIKADNGLTFGYAHLSKSLIKNGEKVKAGQIIALTGNTGRSTGAHLHFSIKDKTGHYLNPSLYV